MPFRTLLFWGTILLITPPLTFLTLILQLFSKNPQELSHRIASLWGRCLVKVSGVDISVKGLGNIPQGPVVFMGNHQSYFDIFVLYAILGERSFSWLAKKELFDIPILGWGMKRAGYIPIDRSNLRKAAMSIKAAAEAVKRGRSVIVFPEGTRGDGKRLLPFKPGGFDLAIKAGVPLVPFVIKGTSRVMPKGSFRVFPGHVEVVFLKPIPTEGLKTRDREALVARVREAMEDELGKGEDRI